jgi:hypothetical protein
VKTGQLKLGPLSSDERGDHMTTADRMRQRVNDDDLLLERRAEAMLREGHDRRELESALSDPSVTNRASIAREGSDPPSS